MWIAFVLCTFGLIYSHLGDVEPKVEVVNCFRSLYLWVDLQQSCYRQFRKGCCELLSFFVPLGWFTALRLSPNASCLLWIAFVLCTFGLIYSSKPFSLSSAAVVNCFRSLYLWVDLQRPVPGAVHRRSCELLSFFVPLGWFTASATLGRVEILLWIAFVLCTFGLIYSEIELSASSIKLWIAFVLCTFGLIYSYATYYGKANGVVNCFRSLYLWVDLQPSQMEYIDATGCELLSFFVPLGWFTAAEISLICACVLWIAFVLCTFGLIYSTPLPYVAHVKVVNCFRSLYLWVDLQQRLRRIFLMRGCELLSFFVPLGWFTARPGGCILWK